MPKRRSCKKSFRRLKRTSRSKRKSCKKSFRRSDRTSRSKRRSCKKSLRRLKKTSRCRKTKTLRRKSYKSLKPCLDGWRRSRQTHRCRKSARSVRSLFATNTWATQAAIFAAPPARPLNDSLNKSGPSSFIKSSVGQAPTQAAIFAALSARAISPVDPVLQLRPLNDSLNKSVPSSFIKSSAIFAAPSARANSSVGPVLQRPSNDLNATSPANVVVNESIPKTNEIRRMLPGPPEANVVTPPTASPVSFYRKYDDYYDLQYGNNSNAAQAFAPIQQAVQNSSGGRGSAPANLPRGLANDVIRRMLPGPPEAAMAPDTSSSQAAREWMAQVGSYPGSYKATLPNGVFKTPQKSPVQTVGQAQLTTRFKSQLESVSNEKIKGDGNCLFRALALGLYHDQDLYAYVRRKIVDFQEKNRYNPSDLQMRHDKCWGSEQELCAASMVWSNVRIILRASRANLINPAFVADINPNKENCNSYTPFGTTLVLGDDKVPEKIYEEDNAIIVHYDGVAHYELDKRIKAPLVIEGKKYSHYVIAGDDYTSSALIIKKGDAFLANNVGQSDPFWYFVEGIYFDRVHKKVNVVSEYVPKNILHITELNKEEANRAQNLMIKLKTVPLFLERSLFGLRGHASKIFAPVQTPLKQSNSSNVTIAALVVVGGITAAAVKAAVLAKNMYKHFHEPGAALDYATAAYKYAVSPTPQWYEMDAWVPVPKELLKKDHLQTACFYFNKFDRLHAIATSEGFLKKVYNYYTRPAKPRIFSPIVDYGLMVLKMFPTSGLAQNIGVGATALKMYQWYHYISNPNPITMGAMRQICSFLPIETKPPQPGPRPLSPLKKDNVLDAFRNRHEPVENLGNQNSYFNQYIPLPELKMPEWLKLGT